MFPLEQTRFEISSQIKSVILKLALKHLYNGILRIMYFIFEIIIKLHYFTRPFSFSINTTELLLSPFQILDFFFHQWFYTYIFIYI